MNPERSPPHAKRTSSPLPLQTFFVIVGFGGSEEAPALLDVTYVADQDLAIDMALEDRDLVTGVAVYALRSRPSDILPHPPRLVFSCGRLPANEAAMVAAALSGL